MIATLEKIALDGTLGAIAIVLWGVALLIWWWGFCNWWFDDE